MSEGRPDPRTDSPSALKRCLRYAAWKACESTWRWQSGDGVFIACDARPQGIGSQIYAVLSVQLFAKKLGLQYCHTPFRAAEHARGDEAEWVARWERLLDLGHGAPLFSDLEHVHRVVRLEPRQLFGLTKTSGRLYVVPYAHSITDCFPDDYDSVTGVLYDRITARLGRPAPDPQKLKVAIHIRRGDVSSNWNLDRFTSNEQILGFVSRIRQACDRPVDLHVYSVGPREDFREFGDEFTLHLDEDAQETFRDLVQADILLMAKSAFSYCAALISRGVVVYEPFWSPPKSDWIVIDDRGGIDAHALSAAIVRAGRGRAS